MYMYFVVGIWLLGLMATVMSIIFERKKSNKLAYALGVPGVISIGSLFAWLICISLQAIQVEFTDGNAVALWFTMVAPIVMLIVCDCFAWDKLDLKFLLTINLTYFTTIIVGVCFVYPNVIYLK